MEKISPLRCVLYTTHNIKLSFSFFFSEIVIIYYFLFLFHRRFSTLTKIERYVRCSCDLDLYNFIFYLHDTRFSNREVRGRRC